MIYAKFFLVQDLGKLTGWIIGGKIIASHAIREGLYVIAEYPEKTLQNKGEAS